MRWYYGIWLLGLAVAGLGCDDSDEGTTPLVLGTYNGGIARNFVDYAEERIAPMTAHLGEHSFDALCVQEFWAQPEQTALTAAFSDMPHTFMLEPMPECPADAPEAACTDEEMDPLQACLEAQCADETPETLVGCATTNCAAEVGGLSGGCLGCVSSNLGGTIEEIRGACTGGDQACWAYGGAFGTMILSKHAIAESEARVFDSSLNRRAALYAKLTDTPMGEVHVFCTHLSAVFADIPYPGEEGTWETEQRAQIDGLRAFIDEKAPQGQMVVMGDFNCGPELPNIEGEAAANYDALVEGYAVRYAERDDAECTFCSTNSLVHADSADDSHSVLLDHILLRGFPDDMTISTDRFMDESFQLDLDSGPIEAHYSDHFGVETTITP